MHDRSPHRTTEKEHMMTLRYDTATTVETIRIYLAGFLDWYEDPPQARQDGELDRGVDEFARRIATAITASGDPWAEDNDYPLADWRYAVANDDTRLGYLAWVAHNKENA